MPVLLWFLFRLLEFRWYSKCHGQIDFAHLDQKYIWAITITRRASHAKYYFYTPAPRRGRGYTVLPLSVCPSFRPSFHLSVRPSVRPSKIFFVAFFSATINGRNLIFGPKLHIGMIYCGYRFCIRQIPTSCLLT
jgi:hypothetical protein